MRGGVRGKRPAPGEPDLEIRHAVASNAGVFCGGLGADKIPPYFHIFD